MVLEKRIEREKKMLSAKPWGLPTLRAWEDRAGCREVGGGPTKESEKEQCAGLRKHSVYLKNEFHLSGALLRIQVFYSVCEIEFYTRSSSRSVTSLRDQWVSDTPSEPLCLGLTFLTSEDDRTNWHHPKQHGGVQRFSLSGNGAVAEVSLWPLDMDVSSQFHSFLNEAQLVFKDREA